MFHYNTRLNNTSFPIVAVEGQTGASGPPGPPGADGAQGEQGNTGTGQLSVIPYI